MMEVSPVTARRSCSSSARKVVVVELERKIRFPGASVTVVYGTLTYFQAPRPLDTTLNDGSINLLS